MTDKLTKNQKFGISTGAYRVGASVYTKIELINKFLNHSDMESILTFAIDRKNIIPLRRQGCGEIPLNLPYAKSPSIHHMQVLPLRPLSRCCPPYSSCPPTQIPHPTSSMHGVFYHHIIIIVSNHHFIIILYYYYTHSRHCNAFVRNKKNISPQWPQPQSTSLMQKYPVSVHGVRGNSRKWWRKHTEGRCKTIMNEKWNPMAKTE